MFTVSFQNFPTKYGKVKRKSKEDLARLCSVISIDYNQKYSLTSNMFIRQASLDKLDCDEIFSRNQEAGK